MSDRGVTFRLAPDQTALETLSDRLARFASEAAVPPEAFRQLALICDELAANVVHHGTSPPHPATFFSIRIDPHPDRLDVLVEDDGKPFDFGHNRHMGRHLGHVKYRSSYTQRRPCIVK